MAAGMRVAVVIVTHESASTVLRTLASVRRASAGLDLDWLVVDSASSDATAELVEAEAGVEVLRVPNRGFAAGLNVGMRRVAADLVVALNPDLEIVGGRLGDVVAAFLREPTLGIVGCPARRPDGSWLPTRGRRPSPVRHWAEALGAGATASCRRLAEMDVGPGPATWVADSFLAIRARAAAEVGGLDERFFLYREETDWCLRFAEAGWRVRHLPLLELVHASREHSEPARAAQLARAKLQFAAKHFARPGAVSTRAALVTHLALRASLARAPSRRRQSVRR
jgi:N-acetylglucosaminyl-diphospho-decaprenol L-rhamnosyltransferase